MKSTVDQSKLVRMYNAFARELVLVARQHCDVQHKAKLKKRFKLFDANGDGYSKEFIAGVEARGGSVCPSVSEDGGTELFAGVTIGDLRDAIPETQREACDALITGLVFSASLLADQAGADVLDKVAEAIASSDASIAEAHILDEDLLKSLSTLTSVQLPDRVLDTIADLRTPAPQAPASGMSIMDLAREISEGMDMAPLVDSVGRGGSVPEADMQKMMSMINGKVQERMRDGSVDPSKICSEAQDILKFLA